MSARLRREIALGEQHHVAGVGNAKMLVAGIDFVLASRPSA
jgi:hypothetical protein